MSDQISSAVEQALYSLIATADDESDDGNSDRATLLHACAATLGAEIQRLHAALADAIECVESWAAYTPPYFVAKHNLAGDLARLHAYLR